MEDTYLEKLRNTELSDLLKVFSQRTWRRLGFCQRHKEVKTFETTITQNLIFDLLEFAQLTETPKLRLLEARDESANGNDIEVFVQHGDGYILFPTQAKSLYPSGKYEKINHQSGGKFQLHALLEYAIKRQGIPLYLFYNYYPLRKDVAAWEDVFGFGHDCFGCSLVNAHLIAGRYFDAANVRWSIPGFLDLHPRPAIPLFQLVDMEQVEILWENSKKHVPELALYTDKEVFDRRYWIDRTPPPAISGLPQEVHFFKTLLS
ncbi:MAG: hypothetical protein IPL27_17370 [Lewinellaceae bacterium]|nr:hypothetical protein [Lewinellaceae bacterium]